MNLNKYSETTQDYIKSVIDYIASNNDGNLPKEFDSSIEILALNYEIFVRCQEDILTRGLYVIDRYGEETENPSIKVIQKAQSAVFKVLSDFGLTTMSRSRMRTNENTVNAQDYLNQLLNN